MREQSGRSCLAFFAQLRAGALVVAAGLAFGSAADPAAARAQALAAMPDLAAGALEPSGPARPISAWASFCQRYAEECAVDTSEPSALTLSPRTWRALNLVNRQVNAAIKPKTDQEHWGVVDRWDIPDDGFGDCEDYQLLKRKILVEQHGLPRRALRMTVVIDEQGEGHAVLMARTDQGDLILDNKRGTILAWDRTGYVYVKREGDGPQQWVSLGDRSPPVTTANR